MTEILFGDDQTLLSAVADALGKVTALDIKDNMGVSTLNPSSRLREDLGLDSFAALELLFEIEDRVGIRIPQEEASKLETVADVVTFIRETLAGRAQEQRPLTEAAQ